MIKVKDKLLLISFISVIAVALANFVAIYFYLYWAVWWFDNVSHFLGGLSIGLFGFWFFHIFFRLPQAKFASILFITIFMVLVIGGGWEIFEYIYDISDPQAGETYWQDTTYDLIADTFGAAVASLIIYKKKLHV